MNCIGKHYGANIMTFKCQNFLWSGHLCLLRLVSSIWALLQICFYWCHLKPQSSWDGTENAEDSTNLCSTLQMKEDQPTNTAATYSQNFSWPSLSSFSRIWLVFLREILVSPLRDRVIDESPFLNYTFINVQVQIAHHRQFGNQKTINKRKILFSACYRLCNTGHFRHICCFVVMSISRFGIVFVLQMRLRKWYDTNEIYHWFGAGLALKQICWTPKHTSFLLLLGLLIASWSKSKEISWLEPSYLLRREDS